MIDKIEVNMFTKEWVEEGRKAGFTDEQLKFLANWHLCNNEDCEQD